MQFGQATFTVTEGQPVATVTVQRSAPAGRLTVDYATSDGTATAPADYLSTVGTLTFEAGVTSQSFTVRLVDNQVVAADKNVRLTLSNLQPPAASTLGPRTTASVLIKENDRGGTFSVFGGTVNEHDGVFNVIVSRTGGTGGPVRWTSRLASAASWRRPATSRRASWRIRPIPSRCRGTSCPSSRRP